MDPSKQIKYDIQDLVNFYQNKFTKFAEKQVSEEAFICFKRLFLIINAKMGKIGKIGDTDSSMGDANSDDN